jgi:CubicO group peptidase (beta-lactamase class C family)
MSRLSALRLVFTLAVLVAALPAQSPAVLPADAIARIDARAAEELTKSGVPGLALAVGRDGAVVYEQGFGFADLENKVPATSRTRFRTASIAKPITAVAVLRLAERGKLDLDAPVRGLVPEWPEKHAPITCRQLLAHLGGVRHYAKPGEAEGTRRYLSLVESLDIFKDDALLHAPGTKHHYTTIGYTLLGLAAERAAKQPFETLLASEVFETAGMKDSGVDHHALLIEGRARGYVKLGQRQHAALPEHLRARAQPGTMINDALHDTSMKVPGGGLSSTAPDLVRFGLALLAGTLLRDETRAAMWTRQKTTDGKEIGYGLGFAVGQAAGTPMISHSGGQSGTSCLLVILPEKRLVLAAMTNLRGYAPRDLLRDVSKIALGE